MELIIENNSGTRTLDNICKLFFQKYEFINFFFKVSPEKVSEFSKGIELIGTFIEYLIFSIIFLNYF